MDKCVGKRLSHLQTVAAWCWVVSLRMAPLGNHPSVVAPRSMVKATVSTVSVQEGNIYKCTKRAAQATEAATGADSARSLSKTCTIKTPLATSVKSFGLLYATEAQTRQTRSNVHSRNKRSRAQNRKMKEKPHYQGKCIRKASENIGGQGSVSREP